jgi:hypothetical protein
MLITKNYYLRNPELPKIYLSTSNAVTIKPVTYLTEHVQGLHSRTSIADLKVTKKELGAVTLVPQVAAPPRTHTRTVIKTTPKIFDPAKMAEVDGFGPDPETPQHDGVQRWCRLNSCAALREAT